MTHPAHPHSQQGQEVVSGREEQLKWNRHGSKGKNAQAQNRTQFANEDQVSECVEECCCDGGRVAQSGVAAAADLQLRRLLSSQTQSTPKSTDNNIENQRDRERIGEWEKVVEQKLPYNI